MIECSPIQKLVNAVSAEWDELCHFRRISHYTSFIKGRLKRCNQILSDFLLYPMILISGLTIRFPDEFSTIILWCIILLVLLTIKVATTRVNGTALIVQGLFVTITVINLGNEFLNLWLSTVLNKTIIHKIFNIINPDYDELTDEIQSKQFTREIEEDINIKRLKYTKLIFDSTEENRLCFKN